MQPVELSQLAEKHKFLARSNISLDHKAFTITSSTASVYSKDVFLRSRIKSDLLKVPAPSPSLSRRGVKKVCSPDPLQAAESYLWLCMEQTWSGHFQRQMWETMINASFNWVKETFVRAISDLANIKSGQKTMWTSLEQVMLVSSKTRTCHCTQPMLACSGEKTLGLVWEVSWTKISNLESFWFSRCFQWIDE